MSPQDIILIVFAIIAIIGAGLYFLNRWSSKKITDQESFIARSRTTVSIYVIDKKKDRPTNVNLPKAATDQMPKYYKFLKMHFVKAKIGPQILTLMCDKKVFNALPVKKNVKVDLAGIYIVEMKGMKSEKEMKALAKEKKEKKK